MRFRIFQGALGTLLCAVPFMAPQSAAAQFVAPATSHVASIKTTALHKAIVEAGVLDEGMPGVSLWHDYGSFGLYKLSDAALNSLSSGVRRQVRIDSEMDTILFDRYPVNTLGGNANLPARLTSPDVAGNSLHLVQFVGPIKDEWLKAVEASGARLVQYVANNAYIVWTNTETRSQLAALARHGDFVQYSGKFEPAYKLGPSIESRILASNQDPDELVPVVIQIYNHAGNTASQKAIVALAQEVESNWDAVLAFQNINLKVAAADLLAIAQMPDVVWVGENFPPRLLDEKQNQILAANFNSGKTGPAAPGYRSWLDGFGFSQNPNDYPIVSVVDDGVGDGTTASGAGDPTLTLLGQGGVSRVVFAENCTNDSSADGRAGHGHINSSIIAGFDERDGFPFKDADGYLRGLGVNPYGRVGNTKFFNNGGSAVLCGGSYQNMIRSEQLNGALISSNSWGNSSTSYGPGAQAYDAGTRDANSSQAGNQEMIFLFAAGNDGPSSNTVGNPGNGKNMITVGASENQRPSDESGNWNDGCAVGPSGADNAMDVINFSSRGPAAGSRIKPEVIAPGTHIQGTASTVAGYDGSGVCDKYRPGSQTVFAASSGTSHSTPAVAGVASLYYRWLQTRHGIAATSPALMKAYLIAHPTYLTGVSGNGNLPTNSQGYGMPDMATAFDDTPRFLINQSEILGASGETWSWSGAVADPGKPVRIVMTYTDAPGNTGTSPQVNDLDLKIEVDGSTYLGNVFSGQWSTTGGTADNRNNYEAVFLPAGSSGALDITITAKNIAGDGVPGNADGTDQDFALVCYNCAQEPGFALVATPPRLDVCAPDPASYTVDVGQIMGFVSPVSLTVSGNPAGSNVSFSQNPVTPAGSSTLTIGNTDAAAAGSYTLTIDGNAAGATPQSRSVGLNLFSSAPPAAVPGAPANGATGVATTPNFSWSAATQASTYTIEVATNAGFSNIVATQSGIDGTSWAAPMLDGNTTYYWRVKAENTCGDGDWSTTFSFTTGNPPFPLPYCDVSFANAVEPITHVVFSDIDNTSSATVNGSPALENFTATIGNVIGGETYPMSVRGNTAGNYSTPVRAYIDWNRDGIFADDATERYTIGTLNNSNGDPASQVITANIAVPPTALPGATRMRVIKKYSTAADPCNSSGWGQAEDYTIMVGGGASYTVTPSVGMSSGSISPATPQSVVGGSTASFTLSADAGYHIDNVGGSCPAGILSGNSYTTGVINADCSVVANFAADGAGAPAITVSPTSLAASQGIGQTSTQTLTIANGGGSDLTWSIAEELARIPPLPHLHAGTGERQSARTNAAHVPFVRDWTSAVMAEVLQDGGFELGDPNPYWEVDSLNFGTVLCDNSCSGSAENAPRSGSWWAWFGGIDALETGYVSQELTIAPGTAMLSFWLRVPFSSGLADDYLAASIDGSEIWRITAATSGAYQTAYQHVAVDVSAFADGGTHTLRFDSTVVGGGAETSNFMLDDVSLDVDSDGGGACSTPTDVPWLSVAPASSTTMAGDSSAVTVTFDSAGMAVGAYEANLCVNSNDPANPLMPVPVSMTVTDAPLSHDVTSSVGSGGGSIDPNGVTSVEDGNAISFILTPATGQVIHSVAGSCGGSLADDTFTTAPVTADCSVIVHFADVGIFGDGFED